MDREFCKLVEREIADHWPGVTVEFIDERPHPKAKLMFEGKILKSPFSGTAFSGPMYKTALGDIRRTMKKLGAERAKPASAEEDEETIAKAYQPPNDGASKRKPPKTEPARQSPTISEQMEAQGVEPLKLGIEFPDNEETAMEKSVRAALGIPEPEPEPEPDPLPTEIADGIYFGMADEAYHAIRRFSTSAMQAMAVSPATFWERSWLNPTPKPASETDTLARRTGRAYHVARLEPDRFETAYIRALDRRDFPVKGTCYTGKDIEAALAAMGLPKTKGGETVAEKGQRLLDADYQGLVWPVMEAEFEAKLRQIAPRPLVVAPQTYDEIIADMKRLRTNPEIAKLLHGGQPEVAIFWACPRTGIPMKCKVDYLKPTDWTDFKTFANSRRAHVFQAIADAFRYERYYMQAVSYRDAIELIRGGALDIGGESTPEQRELIELIRSNPEELDCWYVFQEKGGVPNILARRVVFWTIPYDAQALHEGEADEDKKARDQSRSRVMTKLHRRGADEIAKAKRDFLAYSEVYEPGDPWLPIYAVATFDDMDFNRFWLDGE